MPRDGKYTPEEMKHQNRFAKEIADAGMTMKATLNELSQIRYNEGDINHQEYWSIIYALNEFDASYREVGRAYDELMSYFKDIIDKKGFLRARLGHEPTDLDFHIANLIDHMDVTKQRKKLAHGLTKDIR